jgi:hypothetical protein
MIGNREEEMKRWKQVVLIVLLAPVFLLSFVVIHEVGHTVLARLLGDPDSVFYLARIDPDGEGACLGCNIYDHTKLSTLGNFVVSLGGLLFTQVAALVALFLLPRMPYRSGIRRLLAAVALGFAFLDVPVQVIQGLLYDLEQQTWPTNVDLTDAMLLLSRATGAPQVLLKGILSSLALAYLVWLWSSFRKSRSRGILAQVQPANS